jgi:L-amino acid N-acyltransferase YncA
VVRAAQPDDAAAIAAIYNQGIEERQATFETEPRSPEDIGTALERGDFVLVEESEGAVRGWARVSGYSDRGAYAGVGEAQVYVERVARGRGIASALIEALCEEAERRGYWKLIGKLFPENEASVALLRGRGFRDVGLHRRHGRLDGEWRDVLLVERLLGPADQAL